MNRSLDDLLDALRRDGETPVDPAAVLVGALRLGRVRRVRRRRIATVIGAGLAVVVAAMIPVLASHWSAPAGVVPAATATSTSDAAPGPSTSESPTPGPSAPRPTRTVLESTLRMSSAGDWLIVPIKTGEGFQEASVRRSSGIQWVDTVDVYDPGSYDPTAMLTGTPADVNGHAGFFRWVAGTPTLAWPYAPDAWIVLTGENLLQPSGGLPADLRQVALAVGLGEPTPVRLPFRIGYLPHGLHPTYADIYSPSFTYAAVGFDSDTDPTDWRDPQRYQRLPLIIRMEVAVPQQWHTDTTLAGVPAMRHGYGYIIQRDGYWLTIDTSSVDPLSPAELERVFTGLTLADWHNPSSWFNASY
jgi:hypothetical protein